MKWFHHECSAKHDPKLQTLGSIHGAEGLGIYWGLLEEIGQHSDTFHLKVSALSENIDDTFDKLCQTSENSSENPFTTQFEIMKVPKLRVNILAKNLFTSQKKLVRLIEMSVELGLFDRQKWSQYNVLYSPAFERRADDYTRRQRRQSDIRRTKSVHDTEEVRISSVENSDVLRSLSEKVLLEQTTEEETEVEENRRKEMLVCNATGKTRLSTSPLLMELRNEPYLLDLSVEEFHQYCLACKSAIDAWNQTRTNKFVWVPTEVELEKLFRGGDRAHKLALCYQAYNVQGEKIHYPELVLRAFRLMLKASERTRITNPFGWLWTCLHGNGDGTTPWVQLITVEEEEDELTRHLRRLTPRASDHPP